MKRYNPQDIEPKWQQNWAQSDIYEAKDFDERQKFIVLTEFPYPSGTGLHLGHVREYTLGDIIARHKRMQGFNVLYPMGYDAFGLPTENYAIKTGISPQEATDQNVAVFQKQFEAMGIGFDWSRSFRTTDPSYYKWTQWLFLQFFKKGLAYRDEIAINWCPFCRTGLANEEVVNGRHERCDTLVERKLLNQWLLKITDYADRLIDGLQRVDYPSRIADQQINWIGRSEGAEVDFAIAQSDATVTVFTTRPDTIFGATFLVLAPEHPLVSNITTDEHRDTVNSYVAATQAKSDIERQDTDREKTGTFTGAYAVNPANNEKIPVWVADYVLMGYGTGAIMAVPAHDERDNAFAVKHNLPIVQVLEPFYVQETEPGKLREDEPYDNRDAIIAAVKHWSEEKYIALQWKEVAWGTFVTGGIEEGQSAVEAAKTEIREETGFLNATLIEDYGLVHGLFYHVPKKVNRFAHARALLLKLDNDAREDVDAKEQAIHDLKWLTADELKTFLTPTTHQHVLRFVLGTQGLYCEEGILANSGSYNGLTSAEAREKIVADLNTRGVAREKTQYRLRDWIFSRQHYWGEPIPIIHCEEHGAVAVPDNQLPVELPVVEKYEPSDDGQSPLAAVDDWVNVPCPTCGQPAKRETDTMPNWAGSSWYYLRYYDAHNDEVFADRAKLDYWGEVDLYLGGMEHTTLHLLYSRFWHQFFYDQGLVPTPEPYKARRGQGIVLAADGSKMSKSKGNVVNPTDIIEQGYGADALRLGIAFLAPYDQTTPWNPEGVAGTHRFLNRIWTLTHEMAEGNEAPSMHDESNDREIQAALHRTIRKVSEDLTGMAFNTAVAALMEFVNELYKLKSKVPPTSAVFKAALLDLLKLLAPFAPHISEELWQFTGQTGSVHTSTWPSFDSKYLTSTTVKIAIQVNGKLRGEIEMPTDAEQPSVVQAAKDNPKVASHLDGVQILREIYVPGRLVNFVVKI